MPILQPTIGVAAVVILAVVLMADMESVAAVVAAADEMAVTAMENLLTISLGLPVVAIIINMTAQAIPIHQHRMETTLLYCWK